MTDRRDEHLSEPPCEHATQAPAPTPANQHLEQAAAVHGERAEPPEQPTSRRPRDGGTVNDAVVTRCVGCGVWVRYERICGFDRAMRQVGMFQARCSTCGWQHTTLTLPPGTH